MGGIIEKEVYIKVNAILTNFFGEEYEVVLVRSAKALGFNNDNVFLKDDDSILDLLMYDLKALRSLDTLIDYFYDSQQAEYFKLGVKDFRLKGTND